MIEYHRHVTGEVVQGEAARCIDPAAGAHDVVVMTLDELAAHDAKVRAEARVPAVFLADDHEECDRQIREARAEVVAAVEGVLDAQRTASAVLNAIGNGAQADAMEAVSREVRAALATRVIPPGSTQGGAS